MWSRHCLSFYNLFLSGVTSTAACISVMGVASAINKRCYIKFSHKGCKICSVNRTRDDLPNTSRKYIIKLKVRHGATILSTVLLTSNHTSELEAVSYKIVKFPDVGRWK